LEIHVAENNNTTETKRKKKRITFIRGKVEKRKRKKRSAHILAVLSGLLILQTKPGFRDGMT
jgi:hypothetical protein